LVPKEVEVQTVEKMWYTLRIQPYRTLDNVIEGAVISFVNITETVQMREALRHANELSRLSVVVRDAHDAITVQDLDGRILAWNKGAVRMYGWSEAEALSMNVNDRIPQTQRKNALAKLHELSQDEILQPYRTERITKKGNIVEVWMTSTALMDENGKMYAIATTERAREPKL
jgi:two-component system CheB/CheR fusion protein